MKRYKIVELEGVAVQPVTKSRSAYRRPGLTVCVLDRLDCFRVVGQWRSEDQHQGRREDRFELCRREAGKLASRLEAEHREALS